MAEGSFLSGLFRRAEPPAAPKAGAFEALRAPRDGYVFVISYGLSGDLLVQEMLNAAPGVVVRGENGNLLRPLAEAWHHAERQVLQDFALRDSEAERQYERLTLLGWHLADSFVRDVLTLPAGVRLGGFREIRYHGDAGAFRRQLDFMAMFFPRARFVFNTRNLAEVARTGWWREQPPEAVEKTLGGADALFESYMRDHPARCRHLDYADYATRPESFAALFDWLGLPAPEPARMREIVNRHRAELETGETA